MAIPALKKDSSQVNISNSILKHFGVDSFHSTFKPLDEILERNKGRKVVLFLFDGFGKYIQEKTKEHCPYLYSHGKYDIGTVYPPTTVAATTSILSGKYPVETGWLGWTLYNKDTDEFVEYFSGHLSGTKDMAKFKPEEQLSYTSIFELIDEKNGKGSARNLKGFDCKDCSGRANIDVFMNELQKIVDDDKTKFVYAYWAEPDHSLHGYGIDSPEVIKQIDLIDSRLAKFVEANKDVLFLSIADHGHIGIDYLDIRQFPDFMDTLVKPTFSMEPRFASFWVKPGRERDFVEAYKKHFSQYFDCYSKDQIYKENIFGYASKNDVSDKFIGDFVLIATDTIALLASDDYPHLVSQHAGSLPIETTVELGVFNENASR